MIKDSSPVLQSALIHRRPLISALVILAVVTSLGLIGMGQITSKATTTPREEGPTIMVGLGPLYGFGLLHFLFR
jgi:hypothetical protein